MANLGTLWFGADIDLTALRQKIQSGNQSVLEGLKVDFDPQSYTQMVSKLRSQLDKETFEIKLKANTQGIVSSIQNATRNVSGSASGLDALSEKILRYRALVEDMKATVSKLEAEWHKFGGQGRKNEFYDAKAELAQYKAELNKLVAQQNASNRMTKQATQVKREDSAATKELTNDHIRLNTTLAGGVHISTQLGSALSGLFAVHTARQFLDNVIEIGGQLEKQRISMGAIIGDVSRANDLFENIKSLALKSPFGVVELDQYSKQLAAYGVEQSELFDMTKRLADISAGAGQDIGRLALAIGHVKSATYLTGITLRQFSMNNIPMLKMLADYYSEVEKRAVSTAEVQKRISNRQVSYEDVIEQIRRMTDEGGQFYNMQEKISESLSARFKNLKDSFDIMYGEIAESSIGDMLKNFAVGATNMSRNWRQIVTVLAEAAAVFGVYKTSAVAVNWITNNLTKDTIAYALAQGKLSASMIDRYVVEKQITKAQLLHAVATKKVTVAEAELAAANFNVSRSQLERIATSGRYRNMLAETSVATSRFTVAQLRMMAAFRSGTLTSFGKALMGVNLGLSVVKTSAQAAMAAVTNFLKPLAGFAVFSLVVDAFTESSRKAEEREERMTAMAEKANESFKNLSETREKFTMGASEKMSNEELENSIPELVEQLKNYSEVSRDTFNNAFAIDEEGKNIHSLSEQYEILAKAVNDTADAYKDFEKARPAIEDAIEATEPKSGFDKIMLKVTKWLTPKENEAVFMNLKESLEYYAESLSGAEKAERLFLRNHLEIVEALTKMGIADADTMTNEQILEKLMGWSTFEKGKLEDFTNLLKGDAADAMEVLLEKYRKLDISYITASNRLKQFGEDIYKSAKVMWGADMTDWPENWKERVLIMVKEAARGVKGFEDMTEDAKNNLYNLALTPFKFEIETGEAMQHVNLLKSELENLVGADWIVTIGVQGNDVLEDARNAGKAYDKAKKDLEEVFQRKTKLEKEGKTGTQIYKSLVDKEQKLIGARDAASRLITESGGTFTTSKTDGSRRGGGGSKADEQLKQARTQLDEVKSFLQEYKDYEKLVGKEKAIDLLEELFPTTKGRGKEIVENYKQVLTDIKNSMPLNSEERKRFGLGIDKLIADYDKDNLKKTAERALSDLNEYISKQSGRYDLYKTLFDQTGNRDFAKAAFADGRVWNDAAREFEKQLIQVTGEKGIDYMMTDAAAKEHFKNVEGGYELWKKIVEITSNNYVESLKKSGSAQASMMSIQDKIIRNEQRIEELRNANDRIDHSAEIAELEQETTKLRGELLSISPEFKELFKDTTDMSIRQIQRLYDETKAWKDLIDANKTKNVMNQNGELIGYEYTNAKGEPAYITIDEYRKLEKQLDKLHKKVPELSISFKRLWKFIKGEDKDNNGKSDWEFKDIAEDLAKIMDAARGTTDALSEMFEALGNEDLGDGFSFVGDMLGAGSEIARGIASGNPLEVINGIAHGITSIANAHDKKLDKSIQKSERRVKALQNAYKNLEWEISHQLTTITQKQSSEMLESLKAQEAEMERQLADYKKKKKRDADKEMDLTQEIEEMKQQIATFYEEMGKERYGIDLESWAGDLASAIVDAFAAGEDAADAFDKKVGDIMKDVVKNIIKIQIVKPAMEKLKNFLFGEGGIATTESEGGVEITPNEASKLVGQLTQLKSQVQNGKNVYDIVGQALKSMGIDWSEGEKSSTSASAGIKSITEDTANLLASYINAIRADVSVMRMEQTESFDTITVAIDRTNVIAESQVMLQQQIVENTRRNAEAAELIENALSRATTDKSFGFYVK